MQPDFKKLFPTSQKSKVYEKLVGKNLTEKKDILAFLPNVINILLKIVAPLIFGMFIFAGFRFIYAGNDDEQLKKSKEFFLYGVIGLIFILASFSLMKIIYFLFV